jgi:hypothetical protein
VTSAQIVKLTASPSVWANLSFEVGGILQTSNVTLGQHVDTFVLDNLYSELGVTTEISSQANLLNSSDLHDLLAGAELMSLRAESIKAALDKACALRANLYYTKFLNQDAIITNLQNTLTASQNYLTGLAELAQTQFASLTNEYTNTGKPPVVVNTSSTLGATVTVTDPAGKTTSTSTDTQNMKYEDYGYRMPQLEADAQNRRAQLSLLAEQSAQLPAMLAVPSLQEVFSNELLAYDMDVKRLQVAYFNTILLPSVGGTVTGIYKQVGEAVLPGETVVRIEDTSTIYLVGTLICREVVSLGSKVTIQANLFSSGTTATLNGTVIAVRGDDHADDWWNVVISCPNSVGLAPNCTFDYEDTTVTIA